MLQMISCMILHVRRGREHGNDSDDDEEEEGGAGRSLASHVAALAPLGPHLTELRLGSTTQGVMDAPAFAALASGLPLLQRLVLNLAGPLPLAPGCLLQLVTALRDLRHLALQSPLSSPSDVVLAAVAVDMEVKAGARPHGLVIQIGSYAVDDPLKTPNPWTDMVEFDYREAVPGGAAAVSQLLAGGPWAVAHVGVRGC